MRGASVGDVYDSRRDCQTVYCAGYSTCQVGYLRGLLTGLFKLIATFYMFDLDYPPVHSMFMGIMQTFVTEEQVYSVENELARK